MRIEWPTETERFGAVRIHETVEVVELDSGLDDDVDGSGYAWEPIRNVGARTLSSIEKRMAIVIPIRGERIKVLEGVLTGIPHDCLIVLVSNSPRGPVDRFTLEREAVMSFAQMVRRSAVVVHQRDPGLGAAFAEAGLPELVDDDGLVRHGKGEGMLVGVALARLAGKDFVGFIDSDNYVPGAVHEYVKSYAAGMALASTPYSMVRISWRAKPKIQDGRLFFNRWGRTSQVTNRFFNLLLADYTGFGTDIITTGNAGEHAIAMPLAEVMPWGAGFSVEPYQFVALFELFAGVADSPHPEVLAGGVEVFQIETRNPHFHEDKGPDHVREMRLQALNTLYHSPVCTPMVRDEIAEFLRVQGMIGPGEIPPPERTYPPLERLDWDVFRKVLGDRSRTMEQWEAIEPAQVVTRPPIGFPDLG